MARDDIELVISRAVAEAIAEAVAAAQVPLLGRLEAQLECLEVQAARVEALTTEIAALRAEGGQVRPDLTQTTVEAAIDKSLVPYLKQVQEVSTNVDRVQAKNEYLKRQLRQTWLDKGKRHPRWKFWQR
jgi:type II secretory pathway component PulM